ncbi:hypothetical protein V2J09_018899 [Rumex salicifolius]
MADRPSAKRLLPLEANLDVMNQRLTTNGVPLEYLEDLPFGLISYIQQNHARIPEVVSAMLPTDSEAAEASHEAKPGSKRELVSRTLRDLYCESMVWLQWLMFKEEPLYALEKIEKMNAGQSGICGAVWGKDDVAFRCRTCEHDPTCAICVPCFQHGNHKDHDVSIIYTGGGCCDCGDETAWNPEGFCSKHRGAGMIQPLQEDIAQSVGPVLDAVFDCWKSKLMDAESVSNKSPRATEHAAELRKVAIEFTFSIVEMLLEFCRRSESLLSFLSKRVIAAVGLLDTLVKTERFLNEEVTLKLHELLLKLIGEPVFKYEFGKTIVNYYPVFVQEAVKACRDSVLSKYPLLSTFSVQIFTVPTLTMRLVKEVSLLEVLLYCVGDILYNCLGDDGLLQIDKCNNLFDTTIRLLEDVKFVMSHSEVAEYLRNEQQHIYSAWLRILSFLQGMNPQKREISIHVEEENEHIHLPFYLCNSILNINSLLVARAFSVTGVKEVGNELFESNKQDLVDEHDQILAEVDRMSQESSACTSSGSSELSTISRVCGGNNDANAHVLVPSFVLLADECLKAIDRWLVSSNAVPPGDSGNYNSNFLSFKRALSKVREGKYSFGLYDKRRSARLQNLKSGKQDCQPIDVCKMDIDSSHDPVDDVSIMGEDSDVASERFQVLSMPDWKNIEIDVSTSHISIHIPFHGLLSSILKEALRKYAESTMQHPVAFSFEDSPTSFDHFFGKILKGCQPYGFSSSMMEHPLQTRVFCAQVRAGMWRRNGDAATVSYDLYRSVQWSANTLELDLFLLQVCAAFSPPDLYARRILERFGLLNYLSLDMQHSSEFGPVLVQEMLALIIQIVNERRFCGFTASENMRRELVCKLATGDATRSQLQKSLPRDLSKLNLQEVLDCIAQYSNPSGMKQGRYSLRLSCWKELDLYHPRWSPRDLQVAEEKYLQFCGVSAMTSQLPKWTKIYQPLIGVSRIATCKMVLEIIRAVIFYAVSDNSAQSHAPDGVLITALHLLSLGLDICTLQKESGQLFQDGDRIPLLAFAGEEISSGPISDHCSLLSLLASLLRRNTNENLIPSEVGNFRLSSLVESFLKKFAELDSGCKNKLQEVAPDVFNHLFQLSQDNEGNILSAASDAETRKAKARQRQTAILAKMRAAQSKFLENVKAESENEADKEEQTGEVFVESNEICSLCHDSSSKIPLSFLVLLQKSRLLSFVDKGPPKWDQDCLSDKGKVHVTRNAMAESSESEKVESSKLTVPSPELEQLVRDAVNEFSHGGCTAEVEAFADYLKLHVPDVRISSSSSIYGNPVEKIAYPLESFEQDVCSSIQKKMFVAACGSISTDDGRIDSPEKGSQKNIDVDTILLGKYLASLKKEPAEFSFALNSGVHNEPTVKVESYDGFGPTSCDGIHLSSCGHAVHQRCLDRYLSSLIERHNRRMIFEGGHIVDPDQGEFLCPVCRRLVNSVLPADPRDYRFQLHVGINKGSASSHSLVSSNEKAIFSFQNALHLLNSAASVISKRDILEVLSMRSREVRPDLGPFFRVLCGMYFPTNKDTFLKTERVSPSLIMWDTLKYSLLSTEIAARRMSGTNSTTGCSSFDSELNSSGGFILSLMLRLVLSTRSKSSLDMILRFRSILCFAASICCGSKYDGSIGYSSRQEGKMLRIMKHIDADLLLPDTQFWDRASDPVISRDSFSTLMWILFSLPSQFMLEKESFFSLVHMLYAVNITQGVITYCVKHGRKMADLSSGDCLVTDIAKLVSESSITQEYFVCNYIDPSCNVKDYVRLLSLPFLRRCVLLCKLLKNSTSLQSVGGDCSYGTSSNVVRGLDTSSFQDGLDEVSGLENIFKIPPLDEILGDEHLRSLVPKWFRHFHEKFEGCNIPSVLYITPAMPFQLVRLPFVYQDLLQRYIKPRCRNCSTVISEPALCLLCGRLCSPSWKCCCRESGCLSHAMSCGAGTGVFLLVKRNARRALWPSPYLDAFGEEDPEMRRGKPLYLNEERYSDLNYMVASHGLDRSSKAKIFLSAFISQSSSSSISRV